MLPPDANQKVPFVHVPSMSRIFNFRSELRCGAPLDQRTQLHDEFFNHPTKTGRRRLCDAAPGGRLQPVLMRHPPQLSVKTRGGGGGRGWIWGGVGWGAVGGGFRPGGGVPKVGGLARDPILPHAYLLGGCVSGGWGVRRYVCDNSAFSSLPRRKS